MNAKKVLALALAVLMVAVMVPFTFATATVVMESESLVAGGECNSADDAAHWFFRDGGAAVNFVAGGGPDGSGCIEIVPTSGGNMYYRDEAGNNAQGVALPYGEDYKISMDILCPTDLAYTGGFWIDGENWNVFDHAGCGVTDLDKTGAGEWRHVEYELNDCPVTTYDLRVVLYNFTSFGSSNIKIDNIKVVCTSDVTLTRARIHGSILRSGDFNSASYSMLDWYNANAKAMEYTENGGVDGTGALRVTGGTSDGSIIKWGEGGNMYSGVKVEPETTYKYSCDLYLEDEMAAGSTYNLDFENGGYFELCMADMSKVGEWQHLEGFFYSGDFDNTAGKQLWCRTGVVGGGNDGKHYVVDNISINPVNRAVYVAEPVAADVWTRSLVRTGAFESAVYTSLDWFAREDYAGLDMRWKADGGVDNTACLELTTTGRGNAGAVMYHFDGTTNWGITLEAGTVYKFECDILRPEGSDMLARLDLEGGESFGCPYTAVSTKNGEWEHVSVTFTSTNSSTTAPLRFLLEGDAATNMAAGKKVYVDNISVKALNGTEPTFEEVGADTWGGNLLENGSLNKQDANPFWFRDDWNGGNFRYSPDGGVDNTSCMAVYGNGTAQPEENAAVYYKNEPTQLKAGAVYKLSALVKREAGETAAITVNVRQNGNDAILFNSAATEKTGEWEEISVIFRAPEEAIWLSVTANALATGHTAYVDNIYLRELNGEADPEVDDIPNTADAVIPAAFMMAISFVCGAVLVIRKQTLA